MKGSPGRDYGAVSGHQHAGTWLRSLTDRVLRSRRTFLRVDRRAGLTSPVPQGGLRDTATTRGQSSLRNLSRRPRASGTSGTAPRTRDVNDGCRVQLAAPRVVIPGVNRAAVLVRKTMLGGSSPLGPTKLSRGPESLGVAVRSCPHRWCPRGCRTVPGAAYAELSTLISMRSLTRCPFTEPVTLAARSLPSGFTSKVLHCVLSGRFDRSVTGSTEPN